MKLHFVAALFASTSLMVGGAAIAASATVQIDADDIGGVVTGPKGPEAGVWVIAETKELPTQLAKVVVTDDQGRFVIPDLPKAKYKVWARGYGLLDTTAQESVPGKTLSFTAKAATPKEAAEIYPANYWLSLIKMPEADQFPGTGPSGNGINPGFGKQQDWMGHFKEQCHYCHQLGNKPTREVFGAPNHVEFWDTRIQKAREAGDHTVGPHGKAFAGTMVNNMTRFGKQRGLNMFADWTTRIEKGELPPAPPRPVGKERNLVLSIYDFAGGRFIHDEISSDRRDPTVNANGPVYGLDSLQAYLAVFDPVTLKNEEIPIPGLTPGVPHLQNTLSVHNPMVDQKGRVWMTMLGGEGLAMPACEDDKNGTAFAKYYPNPAKTTRRISLYDPTTKKIEVIPTCYSTHHLAFDYTDDHKLFFSGDVNVLGWIDTRKFDETKDAVKSAGWCPFVLDTNGDGKIDPNRNNWNQPDGLNVKVSDPKKDTRIAGFPYGMNISPKDNSVWYAKHTPTVPSGLVRLELGDNPPLTCKAEYYEPPKLPDGSYIAYNARGVDIDSKGIAWVAFGSGQWGRFDRSKCKVLNGANAVGQHCPEGWTITNTPGPQITGQPNGSADWHYLTWVDLHDTLGLGKDVPILPGSNSDSLIAMMPDGEQLVLRVPYPMGFYMRGLDGRIDDPKAGWKGRGIWANYGEVPLWHQEEGEGSFAKLVKFQIRPDPLAR